jgi:hypothetical protein
MNGYLDTDGVNAPDGIMGPHREKEGSFSAIREIFSPVHIELKNFPDDFNGVIPIENRFHFTNLNKCSFTGKFVNFHEPAEWLPGYPAAEEHKLPSPDIKPGENGELKITLPDDWRNFDAMILTAKDPYNNEIYSWTRQIKNNHEIVNDFVTLTGSAKAEINEADSSITIKGNGTSVTIHKRTGIILRVTSNNRSMIPFGNGPVLTEGKNKVSEMKILNEDNGVVVEVRYEGEMKTARWKMYPSGWLSLDYEYEINGPRQFAGISFSYPENYVTRAKWLGNGPSRVWKNRLQGVNYNVWSKIYNNTQTGAYPFFYPEFKGYFSNFTWIEMSTALGKFLIATEDPDLYLRLYNFYGITGPTSYPLLPDGDISFLDCIPALGSKLAIGLTTDASVYGPAGKMAEMSGVKKHKLWFYFGIPDYDPQTH